MRHSLLKVQMQARQLLLALRGNGEYVKEGYPNNMHAAGLPLLHSVAMQQMPSGLHCKHAADIDACTACVVILEQSIMSLEPEGQTMVGMLTKVTVLHLEGAEREKFNA